MTEHDEQGRFGADQMPGGRSSRGPVTEVESDEPQVQVPPYDGRTTGSGSANADRTRKAYDTSNAPEPSSEPPVSEEERTGTSSTDMDPEPAHGVGKSRRTRGEDIAPDRPDTETGEAGRPRGKAADDAAF